MAFPTRLTRPGLAVLATAALALGLGADAPKQTVDADGIVFKAPAAWKSSKPTEQRFRRAYLKINPVEGDADPAELVVTSMFGDGGGVDANVQRWEGMFKSDEDGSPVKAATEVRRGKNIDEITLVDVGGHYVAAVRPGSPQRLDKPHYRLLGAIVPGKQGTFFLKLTGPEKTVKAIRPAFDELLASINLVEP